MGSAAGSAKGSAAGTPHLQGSAAGTPHRVGAITPPQPAGSSGGGGCFGGSPPAGYAYGFFPLARARIVPEPPPARPAFLLGGGGGGDEPLSPGRSTVSFASGLTGSLVGDSPRKKTKKPARRRSSMARGK